MATYTYKNGEWYDKATGLPANLPSKADSWEPGSTFQITSDIPEYRCPVTGKLIGSRREHAENLKRTGCRVIERGEAGEQRRDRERRVGEGIERSVDAAVRLIAHQFE